MYGKQTLFYSWFRVFPFPPLWLFLLSFRQYGAGRKPVNSLLLLFTRLTSRVIYTNYLQFWCLTMLTNCMFLCVSDCNCLVCSRMCDMCDCAYIFTNIYVVIFISGHHHLITLLRKSIMYCTTIIIRVSILFYYCTILIL